MTSKHKLFVTLLAVTEAAGFAFADNASAASEGEEGFVRTGLETV